MVGNTIPVWVYTAKNGYDWQGLEGSEDAPTRASLDKALAAAGKTDGAWGALVRRPVASRRWAAWPRSRLCWVLFRFHPDAGRDQRGRACNYTAAACMPAGEGLPRLDFAKIFAAPEMAEVLADGYGGMAIVLDAEDFVLREEVPEEEAGPEWKRTWEATWPGAKLLQGDVLGTLSRWCQGNAVDLGDLKAVLREGEAGDGRLVAHLTYAVFPQVAALRAAEEAYGAVAGQGGCAAVRRALEDWREALAAVGDFNRALGGLEGLEMLVEERTRALEEAAEAVDEAERTAREQAAAAASAAAAAAELERAVARYRISPDKKHGKEDNRFHLDDLERRLAAGRARHGAGQRWDELEDRIDYLRRWTGVVEGCLATVRTYQEAMGNGAIGMSPLENQTRGDLNQVRELAHSGHGLFASDAFREMERLYNLAQAQKAGAAAAAAAGKGAGSVPPQEGKAETGPVTYGGKAGGGGAAGGDWDGEGPGHRRKGCWKRWWARWWEVVACVATLLAIAATLGGIWAKMRYSVLQEWEVYRAQACEQAVAGSYSNALARLEEIPYHKWQYRMLGLRRSKYAKELKEEWGNMMSVEVQLKRVKAKAAAALDALEALEKRMPEYQDKQTLAPEEWKKYLDARHEGDELKKTIQFDGTNGLPFRQKEARASKQDEEYKITDIPDTYFLVANAWKLAARCLDAAYRKIDQATEAEKRAAERAQMEKAKTDAEEAAQREKEEKQDIMEKNAEALSAAQAAAKTAKDELDALVDGKAAYAIAKEYARQEWGNYEYYRKLAEEKVGRIRLDDDGLPYREKDGKKVQLEVAELAKLPELYHAAAENWKQAGDAFRKACRTIETHQELQQLNSQRNKVEEARENFDALVKALKEDNPVRYEAAAQSHDVQEARKALEDALKPVKGMQFDKASGLPLRRDGKALKKDALKTLTQRYGQVEEKYLKVGKTLEEAYRRLDEEDAEASADGATAERPGEGSESSEEGIESEDASAEVDEVPATGGESGEGEDAPGGAAVAEAAEAVPEAAAGGAEPGETSVAESAEGKAAGQEGTDAAAADVGSKENGK